MKKEADNYFIYKNFLIGLKDLKKIKTYFWFCFFVFFLIFIVGAVFPVFFEEKILELIKELIEQTEGLGFFELIRYIIFNNTKTAFYFMEIASAWNI